MRTRLAALLSPLVLLPLVLLPLVWGLASLGVARAGEPPTDAAVLSAIDKGRQAFQAGNAQEAITQLSKAIGLIQEQAIGGLAGFLPKRDESQWDLGEVDTQTGQWGSGSTQFQWSQAQRRYTRKGVEDGPEVSVMISNSPQIVDAQRGMLEAFKNPAMREILKAQGADGQKLDFIDEGGWLGMITTEANDCTILALHTKLLVEIRVNKPDERLAKEFWSAMDRAGLAAAAK